MRIKATIIFDVPEHLIEDCNLPRTNSENADKIDNARTEIFKQLYENLEKLKDYNFYHDVRYNTSIKYYNFKIYKEEDKLFEM